jgi:hypothetical protein
VRDLFDCQLLPGSDHIHQRPDPQNPEASYLRPTPYWEMFDTQLTSASAEMLSSYQVLLLAGDIDFDNACVSKLEFALKQGKKVLFGPAHKLALGDRFARLAKYTGAETLHAWINPATGRPGAISDSRLRELADLLSPIQVIGSPVQYANNRTTKGWVVEVVNNNGVAKKPDQPATTDAGAVAQVVLRPRIKTSTAREWRSSRVWSEPREVRLEVGPGQNAYVEFNCP